jgi:8-oxo-dGTP diphosphatase
VIFAAIETDRLDLAPLGAADARALAALLGHESLAAQAPGSPRRFDHEAALAWIARANARLYAGEEFLLGCRLRAGGGLAGVAELALVPDAHAAEIGYWFDPELWGLAELRAATLADNPASARVLAKAGLVAVADGEIDGRPARFHRLGAGDARAPAIAPPVLYVAAVALIDDGGRVLLARRPEGRAMAGLWEFPGGKVEPGERPRVTLARELSEELSLEVALADLVPFTAVCHRYADFQLLMLLMVCRRWGGTATPYEHEDIAWATAGELCDYALPAADAPLIEELAPLLAP